MAETALPHWAWPCHPWPLLTPQGAASWGEDLNFTVMSFYETLDETTAKKRLLSLLQRQGNLPLFFWVKLRKGFINEVRSFSPTPAHTSQQLNLKKTWLKPLPIFETTEESVRHNFLAEQTSLILIESTPDCHSDWTDQQMGWFLIPHPPSTMQTGGWQEA